MAKIKALRCDNKRRRARSLRATNPYLLDPGRADRLFNKSATSSTNLEKHDSGKRERG